MIKELLISFIIIQIISKSNQNKFSHKPCYIRDDESIKGVRYLNAKKNKIKLI